MNEDISAKPEVEVAGKINIQEHFHISTEMYTARCNTTANWTKFWQNNRKTEKSQSLKDEEYLI